MTKNSWERPSGINNMLGRKKVDLSMLKYGIHIPNKYHEYFLEVIPEKKLQPGHRKPINLKFDNKTIETYLRNADSEDRSGNTIYISLSKKNILNYIKQKFKTSYWYLVEKQSITNIDKKTELPNQLAEYIEFYKTENDYEYEVKTITIDANIELAKEFFNYIGVKGKLNKSKYQKSYKLVLLIYFLNNIDNEGKAIYNNVCQDIYDFYKERYNKGLLVEDSDSPIQANIENLTVSKVKSVMNDNSYKVINDKGYIHKEQINDIEYLCFNKELSKVLTKDCIRDLKEILKNILELYYESRSDEVEHVEIIEELEHREQEPIIEYEPSEYIEHIHNYITSKGYIYSIDTIKNFYISLKSKPFVLLAGISGTGKSKLVELFAEAIGANSDNGRYNIIPVRPDWSDPSDLLGYRNIHGNFQTGPLTSIIKKAIDDPTKPYFVCLDEMNLARVEYYFSDILSIMETRKKKEIIITNKLFKREVFGEDETAREELSNIYIPENLYIVGTVNMDETTFPFSKKVLDRANTIEFNKVDLSIDFDTFMDLEEEDPILLHNNSLKSKYLKLKDCIEHREVIKEVNNILITINDELEKVGLQFGYRVRDEIMFYILYAENEELMEIDLALDYAIKQKILPRIQGSDFSIKKILIELFNVFIENRGNQYDAFDNEVSNKMYQYIMDNDIKYCLCVEKVCKMIRRYDVDGFTTFWE